MKLLRLYLKNGRQEFSSFSEFRESMTDTDDNESGDTGNSTAGRGEPESDYEKALDVLGFAVDERFSHDDLKQRYREMLNAVHPDKGFKSKVFAQQINEAVTIIRRARKWA